MRTEQDKHVKALRAEMDKQLAARDATAEILRKDNAILQDQLADLKRQIRHDEKEKSSKKRAVVDSDSETEKNEANLLENLHKKVYQQVLTTVGKALLDMSASFVQEKQKSENRPSGETGTSSREGSYSV